MTERRFPRAFDSLEAIDSFVNEFLAGEALDASLAFDVNLIIEELFTNMVKYSKDGRHSITVGLGRNGSNLTIVLRDEDVDPFDVTKGPPFDPRQPLEERRPGGVGLHLVHSIAESVRYDYRDRTSIVTVTKRVDS